MNGNKQGVLTAITDFLDQISEKKLWRRVNCPYEFKILTKKRRHWAPKTQVLKKMILT